VIDSGQVKAHRCWPWCEIVTLQVGISGLGGVSHQPPAWRQWQGRSPCAGVAWRGGRGTQSVRVRAQWVSV